MIREIFLIVFSIAICGLAMGQDQFQYENVAMANEQQQMMAMDGNTMDVDPMVGRKFKKFHKKHHLHHHRRPFGHRGHHHHHHRFRANEQDDFQLGSAYEPINYHQPTTSVPNSVSCGSNILVGCLPNVQTVPCGSQIASIY